MGGCASHLSPEERRAIDDSRKIDRVIATDFRSQLDCLKLLLLGAGESGKSTILKQMKIMYGSGFEANDRLVFRKYIWENLIETFKVICEGVQMLGMEEQVSAKTEFNMLLNVQHLDDLTPSVGVAMQVLWADPVCQHLWSRRSQFQVIDVVPSFLEHISDIARPTYIPTVDDVLLARVRSTGISEQRFEIDEISLVVFDVGGQRSERRKWIHCFDEVNAVIFVAALNEFDQRLFEDESTNRMIESINLFDEICNSRWFETTSIILFLNKDDLFQEKVSRVNIGSVPEFGDYTGGANSYEDGIQYFLNKFVNLNKRPEKDIFHHVTCSIDTQKFSFVFNTCKEAIFNRQMQGVSPRARSSDASAFVN